MSKTETVDVSKFGIHIQHAGIHVRNMAESLQWYHDVFGFEVLEGRGSPPDQGGVFPYMRMMKLGDFLLEIYEIQDADPCSLVDYEYKYGLKHLNFGVRAFKDWIAYIKTRDDVEILVENYYGPDTCAAYIKDCNGILIEVSNYDGVLASKKNTHAAEPTE